MPASDVITLLTQEYFHLQKTVEDFDLRAVTIKAWSVTASMVVMSAAFAQKAPLLFLLSSVASLMFWLIEARWKEFQQCYYPRIKAIEATLSEDPPKVAELKPLQIYASWSRAFYDFTLRKFFRTVF